MKKIETIAWFYPLWSFFILVFVLVSLLLVKASASWIVLSIGLMLLSELPVYRYKKAQVMRQVAELESTVYFVLGIVKSAAVFLTHVPMVEFLDWFPGVFVVVFVFGITKKMVLESYNKLGE